MALLIGVAIVLAASPAAADCPTAVRDAARALADDATGRISTRFCPEPGLLVVRLAPVGGSLDVEVRLGEHAAFRQAGAFALSPVIDADWESVPAAQVRAFEAFADAVSTRGGELGRALLAPAAERAEPEFAVDLPSEGPPPADLPWLLLVGFALLGVAARAPPEGRPRPLELAGLFGLALVLRWTLGLWGPLHVNGQGPLWLLGAWGRPELLVTYGPGFPETFTAIARAFPGAPDHAVFAANAALSAAVAPLGAWLVAALGGSRHHALLAGVLLACDPVALFIAPSESYYPVILLCATGAGAAAATAAGADDRRVTVVLLLAAALLLAHAVRVHPLAWPLAAVTPFVALGPDLRRGGRAAIGLCALTLALLGVVYADVLPVLDQLRASAGTGSVDRRNLQVPGLGFLIAAGFAFAAARSVGPHALRLLLAGLPFVALDTATHHVFGQSPLWHASYRHVVLVPAVLCAIPLIPGSWFAGRRWLSIPGVGLLLVLAGVPQYGQRTTEQLEYDWLRTALSSLPEGCRVAWVDRAERRVLTIPDHLVPGWSCGTTSGLPVRAPDDLTAGLLPGTCRAWYRSSLCASAEGRAWCDAAEEGVVLEEVAATTLPAAPSYSDLPYDRDPVPVALHRVSGLAAPPPLAGVRVAITVDDLPWVGPAPEGRAAATSALLAALEGVPATGYVNCDRVSADRAVLRLWQDAGQELGNHQARHDDIDKVPLETWLDGVRTCHEALTGWLGAPPTTFRYPYLRNGETQRSRDAAHAVITDELGQRIGRVTADNHEWKYAQLYGQALQAGRAEAAQALADGYVDHLLQALEHASATARAKVGRDVDHVLLLHANALNAHHLGRALDALRDAGAVFVPLATALADPVYARPDAYVGPGGISWLYRIAPVTPHQEWTFEERSWEELEALAEALSLPGR